jgi:hypothetical protein
MTKTNPPTTPIKIVYSKSSVLTGANRTDIYLEMLAAKTPTQTVYANAIFYAADELVTLESDEQCKAYLLLVEPCINPIQLVHQLPHSPKVWSQDSPKVVYLPGTTKGASAADSTFSMRGEKPPRWPDAVDIVIYRTKPDAPQVPYVWFTRVQKFHLYMLLTQPGEDWIQLKVRVRKADVAYAHALLNHASKKRTLTR